MCVQFAAVSDYVGPLSNRNLQTETDNARILCLEQICETFGGGVKRENVLQASSWPYGLGGAMMLLLKTMDGVAMDCKLRVLTRSLLSSIMAVASSKLCSGAMLSIERVFVASRWHRGERDGNVFGLQANLCDL